MNSVPEYWVKQAIDSSKQYTREMSEKRKPEIVIVAKKSGKKANRIELFPVRLWRDKYPRMISGDSRFRVRLNGKWVDKGKMEVRATFTVTCVMSQLRKLLKRKN